MPKTTAQRVTDYRRRLKQRLADTEQRLADAERRAHEAEQLIARLKPLAIIGQRCQQTAAKSGIKALLLRLAGVIK